MSSGRIGRPAQTHLHLSYREWGRDRPFDPTATGSGQARNGRCQFLQEPPGFWEMR
jgi:hypothetical protein